jgi:hypothetical protein
VIVADARDGLGEALSKDHHGELQHEELLSSFGAVGTTATLILAVPRQTAIDLFGGSTLQTDRMRATPPRDGFFRVLGTGGEGILFGALAIPG